MGLKPWSKDSYVCRPKGTIAAIIEQKKRALENDEDFGCLKIKTKKKSSSHNEARDPQWDQARDDEDCDSEWDLARDDAPWTVKKRKVKKMPQSLTLRSKSPVHIDFNSDQTLNGSTSSKLSPRKNFACCFDECSDRFVRSEELEAHLRRKHRDQPIYYCKSPGCTFRSGSRIRLFEHEVSIPSWHFTFKCPITSCSYSCPSAKALAHHQELDHSLLSFESETSNISSP